LAAGLALGAPAVRAQDAPVPPSEGDGTEQRFGDWTLRCFPATESLPRRCEMVQVLGDTQSKQEVLLMAVGYPDAQSGPIAWLVLPLGILLPPGLGLKIDQGETRGLPIRSCDPRGCATPWPLSEADIAALKQGQELVVIFQDIDGKKLGLPVSLQGFTAAFSQLR
jgi:invasion protein IalB